MPAAALLHLRTEAPLADPPGPSTQISATGTPLFGIWTTNLLDPAVPTDGGAQVVQQISFQALGGSPLYFVHGRWLTRPLAAQVIGAANWTLYAVARMIPLTAQIYMVSLWGFTVAQWRPGTGVIARAVDLPLGGTAVASTGTADDRVAITTAAGGALTLLTGDCLILELWSHWVYSSGAATSHDYSVLLGGRGQYLPAFYKGSTLVNTDATLLAPQAIPFS